MYIYSQMYVRAVLRGKIKKRERKWKSVGADDLKLGV
jgi:hypothetical protein